MEDDHIGLVKKSLLGGLAADLAQMRQPVKFLELDILYAEPKKIPADKVMIVAADGTTWNPGGGAGVYARISGVWVKL